MLIINQKIWAKFYYHCGFARSNWKRMSLRQKNLIKLGQTWRNGINIFGNVIIIKKIHGLSLSNAIKRT